MCEERFQLVKERHLASLAYAQALRVFQHQKNLVSVVERQRLRNCVDEAAARCKTGRIALQQYKDDHPFEKLSVSAHA